MLFIVNIVDYMPPRKQKRKNEREDEEMDRAEGKSKWAQLIEQEEEEQE